MDTHFSYHDVLHDGSISTRTLKLTSPQKMQWSLDHEAELFEYTGKAVKRIAEHYTWDKVTDGYEELFRELVAGKYPWKLRM